MNKLKSIIFLLIVLKTHINGDSIDDNKQLNTLVKHLFIHLDENRKIFKFI